MATGAIRWGAVDAARRRAMRRVLVASAVAHAAGVALLAWSPALTPNTAAPLAGAIPVELVAAPPSPAPAPRARPAPPPKPVREKVVLPKDPQPAPKPKPKPEPEPRARPEPKPEPRPEPKPEPAARSLEDVMRELENEEGALEELEGVRQAAAPRATTPGVPGGSTRGVRVDPAVAGWLRRARIHVRRSWVLAPGFRTQALETHVRVRLDAQGNLLEEPTLTRRSGNPWYDESVLRALQKASPLPAPPEAGEWPFVFRPEDSL